MKLIFILLISVISIGFCDSQEKNYFPVIMYDYNPCNKHKCIIKQEPIYYSFSNGNYWVLFRSGKAECLINNYLFKCSFRDVLFNEMNSNGKLLVKRNASNGEILFSADNYRREIINTDTLLFLPNNQFFHTIFVKETLFDMESNYYASMFEFYRLSDLVLIMQKYNETGSSENNFYMFYDSSSSVDLNYNFFDDDAVVKMINVQKDINGTINLKFHIMMESIRKIYLINSKCTFVYDFDPHLSRANIIPQ